MSDMAILRQLPATPPSSVRLRVFPFFLTMKETLKRFPLLRQLLSMRSDLLLTRASAEAQLRVQKEQFTLSLLAQPRYSDPKRLNRYEAQVYSQNGEDGIIAEIFSRIGTTNRVFVEVGAGDGTENNSVYLLVKGWSGFWFDGDEANLISMHQHFAKPLAAKRLLVAREFLTAENALDTLRKHGVPNEFDLFSLDVDRNTSWIWRGLKELRPRVVVVEYNAHIPPQDAWEIHYAAEKTWDGTLMYGAGLLRFEQIGSELGYSLVGCDVSGSNAFFVRRDLVSEKFCSPFTAANHYEPIRLFLGRRWGHRRGFEF